MEAEAITEATIRQLIDAGESETAEFRNVPSHPDMQQSMARVMVAFANTHGGTILVGVDHRHHITGAPGAEIEGMLREIATKRTKPSVETTIRSQNMEGKPVYVITIAPSKHRHMLASNGLPYMRVGKSEQLA